MGACPSPLPIPLARLSVPTLALFIASSAGGGCVRESRGEAAAGGVGVTMPPERWSQDTLRSVTYRLF